jgi:hypothetical protein
MISPDRRTDYEKLLELLGNPEEAHLDFKATVDLGKLEDRLRLVKDVVTMSNRPPGGYILIGVDDEGTPCSPIGSIQDRRQFDGANLGRLVRGYIEGEIHLLVQIHEHDGYEIVMIFVEGHRDGLPVPFSKDGQYPGPKGKSVPVFRAGELFVREGAENVPIRHAHWQDVLSVHDEKIRSEASDFAQKLIREFLAARQDATGGAAADIPLLMDMDEATFAEAEVALLRSENDIRLEHFVRSLSQSTKRDLSVEDYEAILDRWVVFSAQALYFKRADLVEQAIGKVCDTYTKLGVGPEPTRKRLATVIRIYALGSLAVRLEAWEIVRSLSLRPVPSETYGAEYIYSSWIRHGQVDAARANLTKERNGFIISAARELMVMHPAMRPDLTDADVPTEVDISADDVLLDSLCEFDMAYCVIVFANGTDHAEAFPSSAAFAQARATPMAERIVDDAKVRGKLVPDTTNTVLARALRETYKHAFTDSINYGGLWGGPRGSVDEFIERYDTGS